MEAWVRRSTLGLLAGPALAADLAALPAAAAAAAEEWLVSLPEPPGSSGSVADASDTCTRVRVPLCRLSF